MDKGSNPIIGKKWLQILGLIESEIDDSNFLINKIIPGYHTAFANKLGTHNKKKMNIHVDVDDTVFNVAKSKF